MITPLHFIIFLLFFYRWSIECIFMAPFALGSIIQDIIEKSRKGHHVFIISSLPLSSLQALHEILYLDDFGQRDDAFLQNRQHTRKKAPANRIDRPCTLQQQHRH